MSDTAPPVAPPQPTAPPVAPVAPKDKTPEEQHADHGVLADVVAEARSVKILAESAFQVAVGKLQALEEQFRRSAQALPTLRPKVKPDGTIDDGVDSHGNVLKR
jgi:hypothetical protein